MTDEPTGAPAERTIEALRGWYGVFNELGRQFGLNLGMHSSDAAALVQIATAEERGTPLTQTQLSRRIGLTTPATSSLLNRLEDAGHVERHRDRADRRVVTLRSTAAMHEQINDFFQAVGHELDQIASTYPDDALVAFTGMVTTMTAALERHLEAMIKQRS